MSKFVVSTGGSEPATCEAEAPHICDGGLRVHRTRVVNGDISDEICHGVGERELRTVLVRCTRSRVGALQIRSVELVLHSRQQVQVPHIQSLTQVWYRCQKVPVPRTESQELVLRRYHEVRGQCVHSLAMFRPKKHQVLEQHIRSLEQAMYK